MNKRSVVFVGGFQLQAGQKIKGGQVFACTTLVKSNLSDTIKWILIDTTAQEDRRGLLHRIFDAFKRVRKFTKHISLKDNDATLIFTTYGMGFYEKGLMALISRWNNKPVIFAPRSGFILRDIERNFFFRQFAKFVFNKVNIVICQSKFWQNYYASLMGMNPSHPKFQVVQNWIDLETYRGKDKNLKLPLQVVFLGRVDENKGIFTLIDAVEKLQQANSEKLPLKIIVGGNGPALNNAKEQVNNKGIKDYFEFRGWIGSEEKLDLLKKSDIFVLLSKYEGFPNALLEAMAAGLAPIATNISSIPDIIEHNKNGFIVEPGNVEQIVNCFTMLLNTPQLIQEFKELNAKQIQLNNSLSKAVTKFEKIILTLE